MRARMLVGICAPVLMLGPSLFGAQDDAAAKEAKRQSVANSTQDTSPSQTLQQAIAFERYKNLAAEREARKAKESSADRSQEDAAPVRKKIKK